MLNEERMSMTRTWRQMLKNSEECRSRRRCGSKRKRRSSDLSSAEVARQRYTAESRAGKQRWLKIGHLMQPIASHQRPSPHYYPLALQ